MAEAKHDNGRSDATWKSEKHSKSKRKIKPLHITIAALALVLVGGALIYFIWPELIGIGDPLVPTGSRGTVSTGQGMILTPDNINEARDHLADPGPDGQYTVSMTTNWVFETWDTPSQNALVDNLEHNSRTVYFEVVLNTTDEVVYTSPYIPLGSTLENFSLDTRVAAGVYDATVIFYLVDDDFEIVTEVSVSETLIISG